MLFKNIIQMGTASAIVIMAGANARAQNTFTIKGQLAKDRQGIIMLSYTLHGKPVDDSAAVVNGKFQLKGDIGDPSYATLNLNPKKGMMTAEDVAKIDRQDFFLEGTIVTVSSKEGVKMAVIKGGKTQADLTARNAPFVPLNAKYQILTARMQDYKKEMNDTAMNRVRLEVIPIMEQTKKIDSNFVKDHPDSYVAFDIWRKKHKGTVDPPLETEFMHFTTGVRNTEEGRKMMEKIALAKRLDAGQTAPDFTLPDTLGNPLSLSSLKGKNVMLCFWTTDFMNFDVFAFNLGRIERRLHDKNFVMLNVYLNNSNQDREKPEFWKYTLNKSAINGINVADIGGIDFKTGPGSPVAKAYGLDAGTLPLAFLIGPDGKIVARHLILSDKELGMKLEKLLK